MDITGIKVQILPWKRNPPRFDGDMCIVAEVDIAGQRYGACYSPRGAITSENEELHRNEAAKEFLQSLEDEGLV